MSTRLSNLPSQPRVLNYWKSDNSLAMSIFGTFTTGTIGGDTNLYDLIQNCAMVVPTAGRQLIEYILFNRDKLFTFQGAIGAAYYAFAHILVPTGMGTKIKYSFVVDVRLSRWGHHGPAIITGGPVRDRMKHLYRHLLGKPALSSSIWNDVKLPYHPRPVLTAIPGEEFNILIEDLALSDDDD